MPPPRVFSPCRPETLIRKLPVTTPLPGTVQSDTRHEDNLISPSFLVPLAGGEDTESPETAVLTLFSLLLNQRDCSPGSDWSDLSLNLTGHTELLSLN